MDNQLQQSPEDELKMAMGIHPAQHARLQSFLNAVGAPQETPPEIQSAAPITPQGERPAQALQPASLAPASPTPPVGPQAMSIPAPSMSSGLPSVQVNPQRGRDEAELDRLKNSPSGISQIHNPVLRTIARVGDIAGTALFPGVTAQIPGTELHHQQLLNRAQGNVNQDIAGANKEAETSEAQARAEALAHPKPEKPDSPEQQFIDSETAKGTPIGDAIQKYTDLTNKAGSKSPIIHETDQGIFLVDPDTRAATPLTFNGKPLMPKQPIEKPEKPLRQLMLVPQPDGSSKTIEVSAGTTVPKGAETAPQFGQSGKPKEASADEQRRADLATNVNENLDQLEDILKRRPELFGPIAGRMTSLKGSIGTDDPDVAKLTAIKEYMGMASVGAHAMRNAQHVETAANAIVNGFKNSPDAIGAAVKTARASLQTFIDDANKGKTAPQGQPSPQANSKGGKEVHYTIKNGVLVPQ